MGSSFEPPSEPETENFLIPIIKESQDARRSVTYRALYLFLRSGKNDGCWGLTIDIRPSLGVLLEASISWVGQNLDTWPNVALEFAKKMSVELRRHAGSKTQEAGFGQVTLHDLTVRL